MTHKYNEMVCLYRLIDDKLKTVEDSSFKIQNNPIDISQGIMDVVHDDKTKSTMDITTPEMDNSTISTEINTLNTKIDIQDTETGHKEDNFMAIFSTTNPKHKEIQELNAKGLSVAEIAKSLNLGQGEVKLVLDLGKR
jgi:DNA-binding NarL/FixJ family response regulator